MDLLTPGGDHASAGEEWRVISGRVLVSFSTDRAADLGPALAVAAGLYHTTAVKVDGTLVCFGNDDFGRAAASLKIRRRMGEWWKTRQNSSYGAAAVRRQRSFLFLQRANPHWQVADGSLSKRLAAHALAGA